MNISKIRDEVIRVMTFISEINVMKAIRNGMMATIPFTIVGSIFLILSDMPSATLNNLLAPYAGRLSAGYSFTFGMVAIIAVSSIGYYLGVFLKVHSAINASLISLISFTVLQVVPPVDAEGFYSISTANFGVSGIFTGILSAIFSVYAIHFFEQKNITIKLPKGVPSYVSNSFMSLLPAAFVIIFMWIIRVYLNFDVNHYLYLLFLPFIKGLQTLPGILVVACLILVLWTCGINGDSILDGIYQPIVLLYFTENAAAYSAQEAIPHITAYGFFYFGFWMGGTGGTLALVLMMMRSRSKTYRSLSKICLPAGVFGINEPVVFGFPIMFNPLIMIPYILTPLILLTMTFFLMKHNFIGRPVVMIPWTTPPLLNTFLVTGGDWRAPVWQALEIVISFFIYLPFFKMCEKTKLAEESLSDAESVN